MNQFNITLIIQDDLSFLARLALRMRKYGLDVLFYEKKPKLDGTAEIKMKVESENEDISIAMKKIQTLIPVIELEYKKNNA